MQYLFIPHSFSFLSLFFEILIITGFYSDHYAALSFVLQNDCKRLKCPLNSFMQTVAFSSIDVGKSNAFFNKKKKKKLFPCDVMKRLTQANEMY